MAEEKVIGATKMHNLLNFNKLKLYTELLREEMARLYGGAIKFRGSAKLVSKEPSSASEGDLIALKTDGSVTFKKYTEGQWESIEPAEGDSYQLTSNGADGSYVETYIYSDNELSKFEDTNYKWDKVWQYSGSGSGYRMILDAPKPVTMLVMYQSQSLRWFDILFYDPSSHTNVGEELYTIKHDIFTGFKLGWNEADYTLGLSEYKEYNPYEPNPAIYFKILSYSGDVNELKWYDDYAVTSSYGTLKCKTYVDKPQIEMNNAFKFDLSNYDPLDLLIYHNFIATVTEDTKTSPEIVIRRFSKEQIYNFEFSDDVANPLFADIYGGEIIKVNASLSSGDIVTLTPNENPDGTIRWEYTVTKSKYFSKDNSILFSQEGNSIGMSVNPECFPDEINIKSSDNSIKVDKSSDGYDIKAVDTNIYKYKGSVKSFSDLPTSNVRTGDVYNVESSYGDYPANTNFGAIVSNEKITWDSLGGTINYPVTSVNGQTGDVSITIPEPPSVPTKVSELENDAKYITLKDVPAAPVTSVNGKTGAVTLDIPAKINNYVKSSNVWTTNPTIDSNDYSVETSVKHLNTVQLENGTEKTADKEINNVITNVESGNVIKAVDDFANSSDYKNYEVSTKLMRDYVTAIEDHKRRVLVIDQKNWDDWMVKLNTMYLDVSDTNMVADDYIYYYIGKDGGLECWYTTNGEIVQHKLNYEERFWHAALHETTNYQGEIDTIEFLSKDYKAGTIFLGKRHDEDSEWKSYKKTQTGIEEVDILDNNMIYHELQTSVSTDESAIQRHQLYCFTSDKKEMRRSYINHYHFKYALKIHHDYDIYIIATGMNVYENEIFYSHGFITRLIPFDDTEDIYNGKRVTIMGEYVIGHNTYSSHQSDIYPYCLSKDYSIETGNGYLGRYGGNNKNYVGSYFKGNIWNTSNTPAYGIDYMYYNKKWWYM